MKLKSDHRSKFSNLSNGKEEAWKKNQGFNGIRTRDLRDISAITKLTDSTVKIVFFSRYTSQ